MEKFEIISPSEMKINPFSDFGKMALVITGDEKKSNALLLRNLTFGRMLNLDIITMAIKPLRYTKEFIDTNDYFSLNLFTNEYVKELEYLGSLSGRDFDKMGKVNLDISLYRGTPYFSEAKYVIFCKKIFAQEMVEKSFYDKFLVRSNYTFRDFHTQYIGEIIKVFSNNMVEEELI